MDHLITTTSELADVCARLAEFPVITVDTEFLRESTYYPLLCVVQMASPKEAVVIDALAEGIDLKPFFDLMSNEAVLKVFHAARQDIEIVPQSLSHIRVCASVCWSRWILSSQNFDEALSLIWTMRCMWCAGFRFHEVP